MSVKCVLSVYFDAEVYPMAPDDFLVSIMRKLKEENDHKVATATESNTESFFRSRPGSIVVGNLIVARIDSARWDYFVVVRVWNADPHLSGDDHFEVCHVDGFPGPLSWDPKVKVTSLSGFNTNVTFLPATPTVVIVLSAYEEDLSLLNSKLFEEKKKIATLVAAMNGKNP